MEGIKFKKIYARQSSSLALDINGNMWSWGANSYGQLGDGTTIERHTPVQINQINEYSFVNISEKKI